MDVEDEESEDESEDELEDEGASTSASSSSGGDGGKKGWFSGMMRSSMLRSVVGKAALDSEDLEPILETLKQRLMEKNVASEIAEQICDSVAASLRGRRLASFTSLTRTVKSAMSEALTRVLTPKRSVDVLREIELAKDRGRPFVITFVGVNGVGKSTNLAKVAYWLVQQGLKVTIVACDTFRAGAVEQLRTHCARLEVDLFEKGYEKDPANVAAEGIRQAQRDKADVVLVDTAGRMQDNEPLMRALSKLINLNDPDLVLFVGEALVGNDGVDQLKKFNQALVDLSSRHVPRIIDGILLTKFDTIDDKVGAALSMVYESGAPIVFVGCGQTYTDLRRLNVKLIVSTLLA